MKVRDVMTSSVETVGPAQSARDAATLMMRADAGVIPVVEDGRLIGVVTDRDIAVRGVAQGHGPETLVRDLMSGDLVCARANDDVTHAASQMSEAQVRRLPVIDDQDKLCGIVSLADLSRDNDDAGAAAEALHGVSKAGGEHQQ